MGDDGDRGSQKNETEKEHDGIANHNGIGGKPGNNGRGSELGKAWNDADRRLELVEWAVDVAAHRRLRIVDALSRANGPGIEQINDGESKPDECE